jgi:hypothetical protein
MPLVDNDTFLSEVVDFISQAKSTKNGVNSVYLTYKRHSVVPDSKNDATPSSSAPQQTSSSSSSSSSSSGKRKRSQKSSDSKSNKKVKHWLPKEVSACVCVCGIVCLSTLQTDEGGASIVDPPCDCMFMRCIMRTCMCV